MGRWRRNLESPFRGLRSAPRPMPSPVRGCAARRQPPPPLARSFDAAFSFDVGRTRAPRVANIRLGF